VEIEGLSVRYPGAEKDALRGLSLSISEGKFFGLLGPNGAGKTTLISFLCGQVEGQYGTAKVMGVDRKSIRSYKQMLGYAPQEIALFPSLSAEENLSFFAKLLGLPSSEVDRTLDWVDLADRRADPVSEFSGGMKRRLNLGVALLSRPRLLILDEPTVGVDPQSRNFLFERILELKKDGVTLIYSTHYLEEVKKLCDDVGIIQNGKLTASGKVSTVLGEANLEEAYLDLTGRVAQ
jgi:ABC-2 type transport system ATP-binding protein